MSKLTKALTAAAGNAGGTLGYVEDVFSTYLYDGTGAAHTITNGIDLSGEGGLTWIKSRSKATGGYHSLADTERGAGNILRSDFTQGQFFDTAEFTSFNSDGFTVGNDTQTNGSGETYASWTFRKAEKFFDVVTYTGDGSSPLQTISHSLGSSPAVIIAKRTDSDGSWWVWHKDFISNQYYMRLDSTAGQANGGTLLWETTDTTFSVSSATGLTASGGTYVAYLFASDAGGFGDDGSESIIKCGSYTGTGAVGLDVNLGFEPQWLMVKRTDSADNWVMADSMRGIYGQNSPEINHPYLQANLSNAELVSSWFKLNADGFQLQSTGGRVNASGGNYIYIAIRRPMKTPESGTEVFNAIAYTGDGTNSKTFTGAGFPTDLVINNDRARLNTRPWFDRLRGGTQRLASTATSAEGVVDYGVQSLATMDGYIGGTGDANTFGFNASGITYANYYFKRATGFFDMVAYTGTGVANTSISHNLGVTPELIIYKIRSQDARSWIVWQKDLNSEYVSNDFYLKLESSNGVAGSNFWNAPPTSSTFQLSGDLSDNEINGSGQTYIAYLFATLAGVSKVGSYTGNSSTQVIDCGFSTGARFVLIKAASRTGGWTVFDSARGITSSTADPFLYLNSTAVEQTNVGVDIDPDASGFELDGDSSVINESGETYIFLAIA